MAENAIKTASDTMCQHDYVAEQTVRNGVAATQINHRRSQGGASNRREHTLINKNEILSELQTLRLKK